MRKCVLSIRRRNTLCFFVYLRIYFSFKQGRLANSRSFVIPIDDKHVQISKLANSGLYYYYYKETFNVVMSVIVKSEFMILNFLAFCR